MSQILGVNDPYVIPGTMGGGGTSLPVDSAGYLYNDGAGNLSYDTKPTPEPAGSDHEIQWNDSGTMGASSNLTYNGEKLDLDTTISSHVGGAHTISYGLDLADTINATESTGGWIYGTRTHRAINIVGSIPATNRIRTNLYGEYIRLTDSSVFDETVYAAGYLRANSVGPPSNGESVVLGTVTYTFKTTLASEGDVKIAATMQETLENLMDAVNGTGTVGVEHQCTTANADAICTSVTTTGLPVITFQAKTAGTPGDSVAFTESCARLAVNITGATTLGRSAYQNSLYWADVSLSGSTAKGSSMYGVNLMMNGNSFPGNQSQQQYAFVAQMICNGSDETHTRGEMGGINIAMNTFGGRPSSMRGFIFSPQVVNDAATYFGSTPEVTGFYCGDIQGGAVGKVDVAYGLYVADLNGSSAAATTAYGIYIAGATQNNYIAGNLEVAGTLTARNILYANVGTAPSAAPVDAVATWCADYASGDARLYIMGEGNTGQVIIGKGMVHIQRETAGYTAFTETANSGLIIEGNGRAYIEINGDDFVGINLYQDNTLEATFQTNNNAWYLGSTYGANCITGWHSMYSLTLGSIANPADTNSRGVVMFVNDVGVAVVAPTSATANAVQTWCADYAAGDARLYLMGEKNTNTLALGAGNVHFSPTTMADDSVSGETFTGTAGENLVWGDVVYLKSDGKFWKADFNATTTTPAVAFCTGTINADASGEFLRRGWIRDDSAYNFTFGAQAGTIYLGESGAITQTAPSGSGDQVQVLGWALEADIWYFDPQFVIVEV